MTKIEKCIVSGAFALFIVGMIEIFIWFPTSTEELRQAKDYNLVYTYKQGREHVADLLGDANEIRAEVWFDYDLGHEIYKVNGKFQDKMPTKWWRRRACK